MNKPTTNNYAKVYPGKEREILIVWAKACEGKDAENCESCDYQEEGCDELFKKILAMESCP